MYNNFFTTLSLDDYAGYEFGRFVNAFDLVFFSINCQLDSEAAALRLSSPFWRFEVELVPHRVSGAPFEDGCDAVSVGGVKLILAAVAL